MRKRVFGGLVPFVNSFAQRLAPFGALSEEQQEMILPLVLDLSLADSREQSVDSASTILQYLPISADEAAVSISALTSLIGEWVADYAPVEQVINELAAIGLFQQDTPGLQFFLEKVFTLLYNSKSLFLRKLYVQSALSCFSDITTLIDMRAVFDTTRANEGEEEITKTNPEMLGWAPVVIIQISFSKVGESGTSCEFQVTEDNLDRLIAELSRTKSELSLVKSRLAARGSD